MPRPLALVFAVLLLGPVAAAPVPKALKKKVPDMTGTVWVSDESAAQLGVMTYTFHEGGKLTWSYQNGTHTAGSWAQDGEKLTWELNRRFVEYTTEYDGAAFVGGAVNQNKTKWAIALKPKEEKK